MRKSLSGLAACALLTAPLAAQAADLVRAPAYKAPPSPPAIATWTGLYAGLSLGARWLDADWTTTQLFDITGLPFPLASDPNAAFRDTAVRIGGYLGYNWQVASSWLVGMEIDVGWAKNDERLNRLPGAFNIFPTATPSFATVEATWDASLRARLGMLLNPTVLIYATGGLALLHVEASGVCPADNNSCNPAFGTQSGSISTTRVGWTAGAGVEVMRANWLGRIEYRYADLGRLRFNPLPIGPTTLGMVANLDVEIHTLLAGIAYKFDWGTSRVVARY